MIPDLMARLVNSGSDVRLEWFDRAPVCGYRVLRATQPNGPFTDISGPLVSPTFDDLGAGSTPDFFFYQIKID